MTTDVSRRSFGIVLGAGLAAGACGKSDKQNKVDYKFGFPPNYGIDPNEPRTDDFRCNYIGVVHIKQATGWDLSINHAAFQITTKMTEAERLKKAIGVLAEKGSRRFRDLIGDYAPYVRPTGADSEAFDSSFGFKSPNELFIFIEGANIEVRQGALLSFTPLGYDLSDRDENWSFYHANRVNPDDLAGASLAGRMIRVRNYMTLKGDKPIDPANREHKQRYSMNIHFSVDGSGGYSIPMIIDPDTGNGMGHNP